MKNITINIPDIYDENIQKLIKLGVVPSRSEAIRIALREFFQNEFKNMQLLGFLNNFFWQSCRHHDFRARNGIYHKNENWREIKKMLTTEKLESKLSKVRGNQN